MAIKYIVLFVETPRKFIKKTQHCSNINEVKCIYETPNAKTQC